MPFQFTPPDGYRNVTAFPTKPANETAFRDEMMSLLDQLTGFINTTFAPTTAGINYFVNTVTGNDTNDGLSAGAPLKTIQAAINKLPLIINHAVTITVAVGTSSEVVTTANFLGGGSINILGDTTATDTRTVSSITVNGCKCRIIVRGMKCTTTTTDGFSAIDSSNVEFNACKIDAAAASFQGVQFARSSGTVKNSVLANRNGAIVADEYSTVYADTNFGTGNVIGLISRGASTIGKASATQPTGATAEFQGFGGVIR